MAVDTPGFYTSLMTVREDWTVSHGFRFAFKDGEFVGASPTIANNAGQATMSGYRSEKVRHDRAIRVRGDGSYDWIGQTQGEDYSPEQSSEFRYTHSDERFTTVLENTTTVWAYPFDNGNGYKIIVTGRIEAKMNSSESVFDGTSFKIDKFGVNLNGFSVDLSGNGVEAGIPVPGTGGALGLTVGGHFERPPTWPADDRDGIYYRELWNLAPDGEDGFTLTMEASELDINIYAESGRWHTMPGSSRAYFE